MIQYLHKINGLTEGIILDSLRVAKAFYIPPTVSVLTGSTRVHLPKRGEPFWKAIGQLLHRGGNMVFLPPSK